MHKQVMTAFQTESIILKKHTKQVLEKYAVGFDLNLSPPL